MINSFLGCDDDDLAGATVVVDLDASTDRMKLLNGRDFSYVPAQISSENMSARWEREGGRFLDISIDRLSGSYVQHWSDRFSVAGMCTKNQEGGF